MSLQAQTEEDFYRARNKALFNEIQHFVNQEESHLLSFNDVKQLLKPQNEVYLGMQVVPINLIAGSEGRYYDFDNHFFPKNIHLKTRWERIDEAHLTDVILPPIKLYEIGGLYFVRDGNHRVSVARSKGVECIDAEVVSLKSEIKLKPGMTKAKILKEVINYEKRVFYMETAFGDITDFWKLDFSTTGQYDVIYNHILTHKYFINQDKTEEISMQDAILSWYENVYSPVVAVIKKRKIMRKFRGRTTSDMYVWLIKYWDELKTKFGSNIELDDIADGFKRQFGIGFFRNFFKNKKSKS
ncbi:MAG: transcriptional regulator [Spirochaetaceae bacterium]|nr:transcriptional regulator [Spirochaetaceae bacterium]MBO4728878.1 transcriptional regulator [Spirochaetaceae bacterium]MBR4825036.1 transcriptional regulator [Spirochaetaceae bacterium]